MRTKRSTFRRTKNIRECNTHIMARRGFRDNVNHARELYDMNRPRSMAELETMRLAALRRPGGIAARLLDNLSQTIKPKKASRKKA